MRTLTKTALTALIALIVAGALAACSNASASSGSATESDATEEQVVTREDVEPILNKAAAQEFTNVAFTMKTETTATGGASNGAAQSQTVISTTTGQLDRSGEKPKLHMSYEAMSNMQLGRTTYEMFIDSSNLIVKQNEQLYVDAMTDQMLESYAASATSIIEPDEIESVLDMAASYKLTEEEGATTVSVTVDKNKLMEAAADSGAEMPENSSVATMVVSYTVGSDDRFKAVRIMSSTSGSPTYRVHQTYQYADYNTTALPEWPDLQAYVAERSGIKTDENGRMYIVDDDGQIYYVSNIGDDGMIYFDTSTTNTDSGSNSTTYYYETPTTQDATSNTGTTNTTSNTGTTSGSGSSEDKGRAYITADDGTIHFLDEEGSHLYENADGTRYFIDADGNFYFLAND